jgi:hypothetical protein
MDSGDVAVGGMLDVLVPGPSELRWSLPGHGVSEADCGQWRFFGHTAGSGRTHYRRVPRRCGRFACPTCALADGGWADREAGAISDRIRVGVSLVRRRAIHVVVSPPPDSAFGTRESYTRLRNAAYAAARAHGFRGGCAVFHHLRLGSRRFNKGSSLGCRQGPHFHLIGDGWIDSPGCLACVQEAAHKAREGPSHSDHLLCGADAVKMAPHARWCGWIVKNLGVRSTVRGTAFYLLTHASRGNLPMPDLRGPEVVTWFGSMAYNRLRIEAPEAGSICCGVCKQQIPLDQWFRVAWVGVGEPPTADSGLCEPGQWDRAQFIRGDAPSSWPV